MRTLKSPPCEHQGATTTTNLFTCSIGLYGGHPYLGNCIKCIANAENNAAHFEEFKKQAAMHEKSKTVENTARRKPCCGSKITPFST